MKLNYYERLQAKRGDDSALATCIEKVVNQLDDIKTTGDRPGVLLGKIQSGKTRAFVGVIAKAFDRGFNIAIVLTKGTKTLSAQTVSRLKFDFKDFIDDDELLVLDIKNLPGKLTKSELNRKLVIVSKKQIHNLFRLTSFITENDILKDRRFLLIDDEADLASIRFVRASGQEKIEQGKIAEQIDQIRRLVEGIAFLQVTATPYSLYLQPEDYDQPEGNEIALKNYGYIFKPKKPAFTELLPIHSAYVGGDDFFGSFDQSDPRHYLYIEVDKEEQDSLRKSDRRRINQENVLETRNTLGIRRAIVTFVLASFVRRWQQNESRDKQKKYSMVIHNDTQKAPHRWQEQVLDWIVAAISESAEKDPTKLLQLFSTAFDDIKSSVMADKGQLPPFNVAFEGFLCAFKDGYIVREKINSDSDVILDDKAELQLRTPFNIFVGGNILDRGITIPNLISFYYGRNPRTMQADTVLQHSRIYGSRDRKDLAVTRLYTSREVYNRLYTINEFENTLREAFENGAHDRGVVFIQTDADNRVRPCAPDKVLLSNLLSVKPNGFVFPAGFNTKRGNAMKEAQSVLNQLIHPDWHDTNEFVSVSRRLAFEIIDEIEKSLDFEEDEYEWDAMRGLLEYYAAPNGPDENSVLLFIETGRKLSRERSGDKSGLSLLGGSRARNKVNDPNRSKPALILLHQEGSIDLGWHGYSFWWPILAAPGTVQPCVFAGRNVG